MKTSKPVPRFTVDPAELKARQDNAQSFYAASVEEAHRPGRGAIIHDVIANVPLAAEKYYELRSAGYSTLPGNSPLSSFEVQNSLAIIYLVKPTHIQSEDLKAILAEVESAYIAELEAARNAEVDRHVELQLQAERRKALAEAQATEDAARERIRSEVSAAISGRKP